MNNTPEITLEDAGSAPPIPADERYAKKGNVLRLLRDRMLSLRQARNSRIHCVSGLLWVTEHQRVTDLVLKPGESFVIGHQALALVIALDDSRVWIEPGNG